MDPTTLVSSGHALVRALDNEGIHSKVAMWVRNPDLDTWKLWIVPPTNVKDKREFYRKVTEIISKSRLTLGGISASDTEMVPANHPAMKGLTQSMQAPGLNSIHFSGNTFGRFYLPSGIILRVEK